MIRVGLLPSEPIGARMAGIGIRYLELARRLPALGFEVVLATAGSPEEVPEVPAEVRRLERGRLGALFDRCRVVVAQGQLANDLVLECPHLPAVIDLYDPWLVENAHYLESLGLDPFRNDHATWVLQLARGDYFLCSSEEQKLFYQGFLCALGRIHPERLASDPALDGLLGIVPFGLPDTLPSARPLLPERTGPGPRFLFGALYDWYDPWTLLDALAAFPDESWSLVLVRHRDPEGTPQRLFGRVLEWAAQRDLSERLEVVDWVPADRRFDLLREVDCLVSPHLPSLETALSLRTRFLDALAVGCPVVMSQGGTMARLVAEAGAGWVVPPGDVGALGAALRAVTTAPEEVARRRASGLEVASRFAWERVLEPLARVLTELEIDRSKETFGFRPPTVVPADGLGFRVRRWLRLRGLA